MNIQNSNKEAKPAKGGVRIITPEKRAITRKETEDLYIKNLHHRAKVNSAILQDRLKTEVELQLGREKMLKRWKKKTASSPLAVSLFAEDERIKEENKIRDKETKQRTKILHLQKERAKNEIILEVYLTLDRIFYC